MSKIKSLPFRCFEVGGRSRPTFIIQHDESCDGGAWGMGMKGRHLTQMHASVIY